MNDATKRLETLPCWKGRISWERLDGGKSNESFLVSDGDERYVARFGDDFPFHHVDRAREALAAHAASAAGFGPEVVYTEPGAMVLRYIESKTYGAEDVRTHIEGIAEMVSRFHAEMPRRVSGPAYLFWPFHVVRDYARTLEQGASRMAGRLGEFLALSERLEAAQTPLPIVYGHNDLLPSNFLDDGERIWLIDYEYAGHSTAMFDLAGIASNAEFDGPQAERLLEAYFGRPPDEGIMRSHAAMQCASLLREAMWSMVSEIKLTTPGVDYVAYTEENLRMLAAALGSYEERFGKGA